MDPARLALMIPIVALCIPIAAILANAIKKRNPVNPIQEKKVQELELKVKVLEQQVSDLTGTLLQLEEKQSFLSRLLEHK